MGNVLLTVFVQPTASVTVTDSITLPDSAGLNVIAFVPCPLTIVAPVAVQLKDTAVGALTLAAALAVPEQSPVGVVIVAGGGVQTVTTMTFENSDVPSATLVHDASEYAVAVATIESPAAMKPGVANVLPRPKLLPATQAELTNVLP